MPQHKVLSKLENSAKRSTVFSFNYIYERNLLFDYQFKADFKALPGVRIDASPAVHKVVTRGHNHVQKM